MSFGVIFDMDGTLVDNMSQSWVVINRILLRDYGFEVPPEDVKYYAGTPFTSKVIKWKAKYKKEVDLNTFFPEYVEKELEEIRKHPKTIGGVIPLLDDLKKHRVPVAVATSTTPARAKAVLEACRLSKYFSIIVTASEVSHPKPNPDIFLEAAKRMKMIPSKCVVVEDAPSGIRAGIAAKMKTVALLNQYLPLLEAKRADVQIQSFHDLSFSRLSALFE